MSLLGCSTATGCAELEKNYVGTLKFLTHRAKNMMALIFFLHFHILIELFPIFTMCTIFKASAQTAGCSSLPHPYCHAE